MRIEGRIGAYHFTSHNRLRGRFGRKRYYGRRLTTVVDLGPPRDFDINDRFEPGFRERILQQIEARRRVQEWISRNPDSTDRPTDREE